MSLFADNNKESRSQVTPMAQWAEEFGKSESLAVMAWIEHLLTLKGG